MTRGLSIKPVAAILAATFLLGACTDTAARYKRSADSLIAAGKFRTDIDPADAPITKEALRQNFLKIAMYREFNDDLTEELTPAPLRRWEKPIRYRFFGSGVTSEDRRQMRELALRLSGLTNRKVEPIAAKANMIIFYLNEEERDTVNDLLTEEWGPEFTEFSKKWASSIRYPCVGQIYRNAEGHINAAIVYIKNEINGLYRESCLHEEVVQSFGLTNDDPDVRPSIFNDDAEFALLTRHDEHLLSILYDDRLSAGMSIDEVKSVLPEVVDDLLVDPSS